jgi:hypothetical protein
MNDLEQRIRDRAHKLWMDEGRPEDAPSPRGTARELCALSQGAHRNFGPSHPFNSCGCKQSRMEILDPDCIN